LPLEDGVPDREVLLDVLDLDERPAPAAAAVHADAHAASDAPPAIVSSRWARLYSTSSQQRSRWPGVSTRFSRPGSSVHFSKACGQRGRNLQPCGSWISEGGAPVIECSRACFGRSRRGMEPRSPQVYGIWES